MPIPKPHMPVMRPPVDLYGEPPMPDNFKPLLMDQERFLPIANIGRIMKNTLEPISDTKASRGRKKRVRQRQTMYEQYEESGSDDNNSDLHSDDSSYSRDYG
jgi:hypothetical protein